MYVSKFRDVFYCSKTVRILWPCSQLKLLCVGFAIFIVRAQICLIFLHIDEVIYLYTYTHAHSDLLFELYSHSRLKKKDEDQHLYTELLNQLKDIGKKQIILRNTLILMLAFTSTLFEQIIERNMRRKLNMTKKVHFYDSFIGTIS